MKKRKVEELQSNPLSNGETAVMIVVGAAALGAIVYALWPKSAEAKTTTQKLPATVSVQTVTEANNGQRITMKKGDVVVVRLSQAGGTGFAWGFDLQGPAIIAADIDNAHEEGGNEPGSDVTLVTPFQAILPGNTTLRARLMRGGTSSREFTLNVSVAGDGGLYA